jgi:hypothetical protein
MKSSSLSKAGPFGVLAAAAVLGIALLTSPAALAAERSPDTGFEQLLEPYEAVRLALAADSVEGVANHARQIETILQRLSEQWSAQRAGVEPRQADEARALLPEMKTAALQLAIAESLPAARDAFYALSKPLVRWHSMATGEVPVVAYCSMSKRSWLQPAGEIGNPYFGESMLQCGEVVDG